MSSFRSADANTVNYWVNKAINHVENIVQELGSGTSGTSILGDLAAANKALRRLQGLDYLTRDSVDVRSPCVNLTADDAVFLAEVCPRVIDWLQIWASNP